ncbi:hypothetical protein ACOME3_003937 [Neoechinorhynchus agilis]
MFCYRYPDGRDTFIDLSSALSTSESQRIEVTEEQYELYCEMGMTFELCKICDENSKDVCIEPCNHLICSNCLKGWLDKGSNTCPFCRQEIKGHHSVEIGSFRRKTDEDDEQLLDDIKENEISICSSTRKDAFKCLIEDGYPEEDAKSACQLARDNFEFAIAILGFVRNYRFDSNM